MKERYIEPTQESGAALFSRDLKGEVIMLNLLRFKALADYAESPDLAPANPVSGQEAFQKYIDWTLPFLERSGGSLMLLADGGRYLIGPQDEQWDLVMLVCQRSVKEFMSFASNTDYLRGVGHRTAALQDSRLLPLVRRVAPSIQ